MSSVSATHSESRMADLEGKADVDLPLPKDYWEQNTTNIRHVCQYYEIRTDTKQRKRKIVKILKVFLYRSKCS